MSVDPKLHLLLVEDLHNLLEKRDCFLLPRPAPSSVLTSRQGSALLPLDAAARLSANGGWLPRITGSL